MQYILHGAVAVLFVGVAIFFLYNIDELHSSSARWFFRAFAFLYIVAAIVMIITVHGD